ncbi:hypothetical protein ScalyP_jg2319 [Parmales sp. scaly parma]|nr:hypothetical protein ScalyP_jg2319 [Parmales sp. scaly parma]
MNIQRVDASRYFILYHFGGVYADLDYEILTNDLWYYLPTNKVGLVESPYLYNELVQNSFMSSPVNSEFWPLVFDTLERNKHSGVLKSTGPGMLTDVIRTASPSLWRVLDCENFQRLPYGEWKGNKFVNVLGREVLSRLYPMKSCGDFNNIMNCHLGKHHGSASWTNEALV